MILDRHVLSDLDDVGRLFQRKLCGMGVVRLKLQRASTAFLFDHPSWSETLAQLAEQAEALEDRGASWLEGMVLIDRIRAFTRDPTSGESRPVLELVRGLEEEDDAEMGMDHVEPAAEPAAAPELPEDAAEPATPRLHPIRDL